MNDEDTIIDGVDVSSCEQYCSDNRNNPNMCYQEMTGGYLMCQPKERQCYFYVTQIEQQLAHKTEDYMELEKRHNKAYQEFKKLINENNRLWEELNQIRLLLEGKNTQYEQKIKECEKLKEKLNPKLKNAHCTYFEGQTGLCRAKEFKRCNPVNCNLYTIDELSTILDLQQQLQVEKQKVKELGNEIIKGGETLSDKVRAEVFTDLQKENDRYKQALKDIKKITTELYLGIEVSDRPYCEIILQKCEVLKVENQ